ncbi:acyl-CoA reductase [Aggregatimonas sangjinii]|uniref:Acyl-CoA reductase n=1 Tax=Aggregatimonas sangjinii TaxID=2583587 RepID=A0A5B7SS01_9FLAO|nr:acyl-CoA reductase [Aggregatimonas sangjinii]QCW99780.1 acyl-CoA reductase [Aggregatimonas sangjinii]
MSDHNKTFNAFLKLGGFLRAFCNDDSTETEWNDKANAAIALAKHKNGWFDPENVLFAFKSWGAVLTEEKLSAWLTEYPKNSTEKSAKTVALIMAGNIPLVGFHDFLSIMLTGHTALIKLSSNDNVLFRFIMDYLISFEPSLQERISITETKMEGFDAVIATGSNNTARYFEYYFGKGPHIIRKNRNSIAVLRGNESEGQLRALGEDIFRYYGLGCRSVAKIFVPEDYDFDVLFKALYKFHPIIEQLKYSNNYDYNKAVYLMSEFKILDNGFLILKEDESYSSPIASLFYERYSDPQTLKTRLENDADLLQCIVSNGFLPDEIEFGTTQTPSLSDYADGVDTVDFLLKI